MTKTGPIRSTSVATLLRVCTVILLAGVAACEARPEVSEAVRVEVEKLGDGRESYFAAKALAEQGEAIVPELITALEESLEAMALYDPRNLGDSKDEYSLLLERQAQLIGLIAAGGGPEHADRLIDLVDEIQSENIATNSFFQMLDALGARKKVDTLAAQIIADPGSDDAKLLAAMVRYYRRTPAAVGKSAALHFDNDFSLIRGMAYQLAINAGREKDVRARLVDEVSNMEYADAGNKTMLLALAVIEKPEKFLPRMEDIRLRPDVKRIATKVSKFTWSSDAEREAMLPDMLHTRNQELALYAIEFMLENDRADLLEVHRLAWPGVRQIEYYRILIPGFDKMSRERLLQHLPPEQVDAIERQKDQPLMPMTGPTMRLALQRFGYTLEKRDGAVVIIPPTD